MNGVLIGKVTHFFGKIGVAVISLSNKIKVGDTIQIIGNSSNFQQEVTSLQIDHLQVESADAGEEVALKVIRRVSHHDNVFKIDKRGEA